MNNKIQLNVGKRIKDLRENFKYSQEQLANLAQLDRTYITSVENGHRNVSIKTILKFSNAFGISVQEFFNDSMFGN